MESASVSIAGDLKDQHGHDEHEEHPPEPNVSSRVEAQYLGMLLFIISEIMLFGAFFTAYFFIRVVGEADWPAQGEELPKLIAGVNTAMLLSSSSPCTGRSRARRTRTAARCRWASSPRSCWA